MQVHPFPLSGQLVPAINLGGLTVRSPDDPQCHGTPMVLPGPVKVKAALAGQLVFGREIVTWTDWPGNSLPRDGLKVMPFIPLPDALQFKMPWESGEGASVTVHDRQPLLKLPGLAISFGGAQLHGTLTGCVAPRKVKVAPAGQVVLGTKIVICTGEPGGRVPLAG